MMTTQVDDGEEQSVYYIVMAEVTNKALRANLTGVHDTEISRDCSE